MSVQHKAAQIKEREVFCKNCCLSDLCVPTGLEPDELDQLMRIIDRSPPFPRGRHLFHVGDPIESLYAVRSGSVKVYVPTEGGEEQVLGFNLPGELLGFDALGAEQHNCSAVTLETTSVCELPYERLEDLCHKVAGIDHQVHRLLGKEISHDHEMLLLLGKGSAEKRLATFLVGLSERFKQRGFSEREFNLSMSRHDIGNYLGLAVETVSRLFARFQDDGLLSVKRRHVQIQELERLKDLLGECPMDESCSQFQETGD